MRSLFCLLVLITSTGCSEMLTDAENSRLGKSNSAEISKAWNSKSLRTYGNYSDFCVEFTDIPGKCSYYKEDAWGFFGPLETECRVDIDDAFLNVTCNGSGDCPAADHSLLYFWADDPISPNDSLLIEEPGLRTDPMVLEVGNGLCDGIIAR